MNLDDILGKATVTKTGGKKSTIPLVEVDDEVKELITAYKQVGEKVDSLTAKLKDIGSDIIQKATVAREEFMVNTGKFIKSIKIPDTKNVPATIVWSNWYSKIPLDAGTELRNTVPNFEEYFEGKVEIKVTKDITEENLKDLINRVGPDDFAKFFEVDRWISPTEKFNEEQHKLSPEVRESIQDLIKQRTPSIKTK